MTDRRDSLQRLADVLGTDVDALDHVAPLDDEAIEQLHRLVRRSLEDEDDRVQEALQATMRFLPRPLRGRAKSLLFPQGQG